MTPPNDRFVSETDFAVRYAETDAMGVVHHASYLVYFEEGRSHYMRHLGRDYSLIEKSGLRLPVTEIGVRFAGSLTYGERVRIHTWVADSRSRAIKFAYEVSSMQSEEILVTGFTQHMWTDLNGKVCRVPDELQDLLTQPPA